MTPLFRRLGKTDAPPEPGGVLSVAVAEGRWRLALTEPGSAPIHASWSMEPGDPPLQPLEMLRRAVRTVTLGQRERVGRVRLWIDDPAIMLVEGQSAGTRLADPVAARAIGAQELGSADVLYAVQPFGTSEAGGQHGVCAFMDVDLARDYIGALDTLAVKLVEMAPAPLLRLAPCPEEPFIAIHMAMTTSRLVVAEPESGVLIGRVLPVGVGGFVDALVASMSLPSRAAADGLVRRNCLPPPRTTRPLLTATEQALAPLLGSLQQEIIATLDHGRFQRSTNVPTTLRLAGTEPVRGLSEWLAGTLDLPIESEADAVEQWEVTSADPACNLLQNSASGLLTLGKVGYHFSNGRFLPTSPVPVRGQRAHRKRPALPAMDARKLLALRPWSLPAAAGAIVLAVLWFGLNTATAARSDGLGALREAIGEDTALRIALAHRLAAPPAAETKGPTFTRRLIALARAATGGLHLDRLQESGASNAARDTRLLLEGRAGGDDGIAVVSGFIHRLQGDPDFNADVTAIDLVSIASDGKAVRFQIAVTLTPAKP